MLALRQAANFRSQKLCFWAASKFFISSNELEQAVTTDYNSKQSGVSNQAKLMSRRLFQSRSIGNHGFASRSGARSDEDEGEVEGSDGEVELSDTDTKEEGRFSDLFQRISGTASVEGETSSKLYEIIKKSSPRVLDKTLHSYVKEGKSMDRSIIIKTMQILHRRQNNMKAKVFADWVEENLGFTDEQEYAFKLDAMARISTLYDAENYLRKVPKDFRGEKVYSTFLASTVRQQNFRKAEEIFKEMTDLKLVSVFTCNHMLTLYKSDAGRLGNILTYMDDNDISPTLATYKILIDSNGSKNIQAVEMLVSDMTEKGIEPDIHMKAMIAGYYISAGLNAKGEEIVKELELLNWASDRRLCKFLFSLYADLGRSDDVDKVWKVCEQEPWRDEQWAAMRAYEKLGKIEQVEAIYNNMNTNWKKESYHILLNVYMGNRMLSKAKDLADSIVGDNKSGSRDFAWNSLIKVYFEAGDMEKADTCISEMLSRKLKPMYIHLHALMVHYSKMGDIHNTERMFFWLRRCGYSMRISIYSLLAKAYVNAQTHAYGIRERIKLDNITPDRELGSQLNLIDAFRHGSAFKRST